MKIGSLFDGIGGFPLVASWYGIAATWASEIESAPVSITKRHFPKMRHLGDITKVNGAEIEPVDIITFGSPCQDLSVAGKRAGLAGARSGLFGEAIRIIEEMREATNGLYPTWAIWENVPGALSSNDGMDFRAVLQSFANTEIPMPASGRWGDAGMVRGGRCDFGWRILDAQFWGVPQRRKRVFIVADFRGQRAAEVLFKRESVRGHFTPSRTEGEGASIDAESSASAAGFNGWRSITGSIEYRIETAPCLTATMPPNVFTEPIIYNEEAVTSKTNGSNPKQGDACHTLGATGAGRALLVNAVAFGFKSFGQYEETEVGKALLASDDVTTGDLITTVDCRNLNENSNISGTLQAKATGGYSLNYTNPVRQGETVRRLTPLECERLQGYPDYWTKFGHDGKEINDSARYKACGNSLALPCVEYFISGISECGKAAIESTESTQAEKEEIA